MSGRRGRSGPGSDWPVSLLTGLLIGAAVIFVSIAVFAILHLWAGLGEAARAPLHDVTEILYFLSGIGLFATAIGALAFARRQVEQANLIHEHSSRSHQATMFLELEKRWKEPPLKQSRQAILDVERDAEKAFGRNFDAEAMHELLEALRESDPQRYETIMRVAVFLETIGFMARKHRSFVDEEHIFALFYPVSSRLRKRFGHHFLRRFEEWKTQHFAALAAREDSEAIDPALVDSITYRSHEEGTYANVLYIFDVCEEIATAKLKPLRAFRRER